MKRNIPILFLAIFTFSCANPKNNAEEGEELQIQSDKLNESETKKSNEMNGQIATFLTFQKGDAEQAMNFYTSMFDNSEIVEAKRWGKEGPGKEGTIMHATFSLNGKLFMCSDSPAIHDWGFTPAVSNFVECSNESELEQLFSKLSDNGKVMMPLGNYGFSQKFGFVEDQFGVSWQLNLQ